MQAVKLNQAGEFEPFKMLISAIMALFVLVIILSAIDFFYKFRVDVSNERLISGLRNAVEKPDGKPLKIDSLLFEKNTGFTANALSRQIGLADESCLIFFTPQGSSGIIPQGSYDNASVVSFNNDLEMDVYGVCYTNLSSEAFLFPNCEVGCKVGFNVDPTGS